NGGPADNRKIAEREQARHAFSRHVSAAHAGELNTPLRALPDGCDERGTQSVAGFLAGNQKNVRTHPVRTHRGLNHGAAPGSTPTTKMLARLADSIRRAGSATMVLPATTAMPASPARMTPSTVRGPIEGRSKRRSCAGLGAFTRVPVP